MREDFPSTSGTDSSSTSKGGLVTRLLKGGVPAVVASGISAVVPLTAVLFLDAQNYVVWALAATLMSTFMLLDFGAVSLATTLASQKRLNRVSLLAANAATGLPPLVLGALMIIAWEPYSRIASISVDSELCKLLFVLIAVGSTLRSIGSVYAGVSLGRRNFRNRSVILLTGAAALLLVTLVTLVFTKSILSLGFGVLASGAIQLSAGLLLERSDKLPPHLDVLQDVGRTIRRFLTSKGLSSILSISINQLDRWIIAIVAPAEVVAIYDVSNRLATMPKIALTTLSQGLIAEAGAASRTGNWERLLKDYRTGSRLIWVASLAGTLASLTVTGLMFAVSDLYSIDAVMIALSLSAASLFSSLTLPPVMTLNGLTKPWLEMGYLAPLAALVGIAYYVGIAFDSWPLLVLLLTSSVIVMSATFIVYSGRYIRRYVSAQSHALALNSRSA